MASPVSRRRKTFLSRGLSRFARTLRDTRLSLAMHSEVSRIDVSKGMNAEYQAERNSNRAAAAMAADKETLSRSAEVTHPTMGKHRAGARVALNLAGRLLWHLPGRFAIASLLGTRRSLRCVLFHDVSDTESFFTKGL